MSFEQKQITLEQGPVTYFTAGAEGRPLLYLHAAGGPAFSQPLAELAKTRRVFAPVAPGFDGTPVIAGVNSMSDLADLTAAFVQDVIGEQCDVMGQSFGGWLAAWFGVLHKDLVGQLVLECPAAFRDPEAGNLSDDPDELFAQLFAHPEKITEKPKSPEVMTANRKMFDHYRADIAFDGDLAARLGEIEALTLILHGSKEVMIPESSARLFKSSIPRAHLIYVYDAAHVIEVDQPERFLDVVGSFLERGEAFIVNWDDEDGAVA